MSCFILPFNFSRHKSFHFFKINRRTYCDADVFVYMYICIYILVSSSTMQKFFCLFFCTEGSNKAFCLQNKNLQPKIRLHMKMCVILYIKSYVIRFAITILFRLHRKMCVILDIKSYVIRLQ